MANTERHWTEDQDLLEQYILGKIPSEQRSVLDRHTGNCEQCSQAVQRERALVAGIRAYGRTRLKERLRTRLAGQGEAGIPWLHVLSAAAVLVVIVGLGVYNEWWSSSPVVLSEEDLALRDTLKRPEEAFLENKEDAIAGKRAGKGEEPVSQFTEAGRQSTKRSRVEQHVPESPEEKLDIAKQKTQPAAIAEDRADIRQFAQEFWVEGIILGGPSKSTRKVEAAEGAAAPSVREGREAEQGGARQQSFEIRQGQASQIYQLQQQPTSALPLTRQSLLKKQTVRTIPTLIQQAPQGGVLTMFTDQLQVENTSVQVVYASEDSLVIEISGLQVAYKLPVQLQQSRQQH